MYGISHLEGVFVDSLSSFGIFVTFSSRLKLRIVSYVFHFTVRWKNLAKIDFVPKIGNCYVLTKILNNANVSTKAPPKW